MDLNYIAGFFDGEGTIGLNPYPITNCGQCNEEILQQMRDFVGLGDVYIQREAQGKWRKCFQWKISGKNAIRFLEIITPHLVLKKAQAEFLLSKRGLFEKGLRRTDELVAARKEASSELKRMKR